MEVEFPIVSPAYTQVSIAATRVGESERAWAQWPCMEVEFWLCHL